MEKLTLLLNNILKVLFFTIILSTIIFTNEMKLHSGVVFLTIWAALGLLFFWIKTKANFKVLFSSIIFLSLVLRVLYFFSIDSLPVSDFGMMFYGGSQFIQGNMEIFQGINYFGRFPHMSLTVMYFGLMQYLFTDALTMTRLVNICFSILNVILLYFIAYKIFQNKKKSLVVMFIAGFFPPMIYYNNVFASENLAMPLFLLSVLFFLKATKENKILFYIVSGIFLSLSHLFRPIEYVVILAYLLFELIYAQNKIKQKISVVISIIVSSILPFVLISIMLVQIGITEYPLWHGTEPLTVSMLKGTNIASGGRWNVEDASVFSKFKGDYKAVDAECRRLIKERFKQNPPKEWVAFYIGKYGGQWSSGDFAGTYWAEAGHTDETAQTWFAHGSHRENKRIISMHSHGFLCNQVVWIILVVLSFVGLFRNETSSNRPIQLLYILFCGFSLFLLITESQARYSYIASWIFPILAVSAFKSINAEGSDP